MNFRNWTQKQNRGVAIADVLMWGAGIMATGAMAFGGYVNSKTSDLDKTDTAIVQRITKVETESAQYKDDIKDIRRLLESINNKLK